MKQNLLKNTIIAGLSICAFGAMNACTFLGTPEENVVVTEKTVQTKPTVPNKICTAQDDTNCIVTYEEPDLNLSQAYAGYAMSTDASYQAGSNPISLSAPAYQSGTSVKERMQQKEFAQQQADLALQPVMSGNILCSGDSCTDALFKTEIEKTIHTRLIEEGQTQTGYEVVPQQQLAQQGVVVAGTGQQMVVGATIPAGTLAAGNATAAAQQTPMTSLKQKIAFGEQVHDWEAPAGETLRTLLMQWGEESGWTVVWKMDRDYNLEAGVVFRGKFTEVAAAFIRSFARATPAPIGTFYKGNRVLVINTQENDNAE